VVVVKAYKGSQRKCRKTTATKTTSAS